MGGSRGGSPTYLAKIRDKYYLGDDSQIDRAIVTIGSVTDFLLDDIKEACQIYIANDGYVCEPDPLYPPEPPENEITYHYYLEDYNVFARVLEPYMHDGGFPGETHLEVLTEARKRLVRSSPYWFAGSLNNLEVNHGGLDEACRVAHTQALKDELGDWLQDFPYTVFLIYDDEYHGISPDAKNTYNQPPAPQWWKEYSWWINGWFYLVGS